MRPLTTLVLFFVLIAVVGAIFILKPDRTPSNPDGISLLVPGYEPKQVGKLSLTNPHGSFQFERHPAGWVMTAPRMGLADAGAVESILSKIEFTERVRELQAALPEYGLDTPRATLDFVGGTAESTFRLVIGNEGTLGSNTWVTVEGSVRSNGIYVIPKEIFETIDKDLTAFRDRQILSFQNWEVGQIQIDKENTTNLKATRQGSAWLVTEPSVARGDVNRIRELLNALVGLRTEEFVADGVTDFSPYGLETPQATVTLLAKAGGGKKEVLYFGSVNDQGLVQIRREGSDSVLGVPEAVLSRLTLDTDDVKDRHVFSGGSADVREITVRKNEKASLHLVRDEKNTTSWNLGEKIGGGGAADVAETKKAFSIVSDLQGIRFVPASKSLSESGLEPPRIRASFGISSKNTLELLIGNSSPENEGTTYVKNSTEPQVYEVRNEDIAPLLRPGFEYRAKRVMDFQTANTVYLRLETPGRVAIFEEIGPQTNRTWSGSLEGEEAVPVNRTEMNLFLAPIATLHALAFISDDLSKREKYGLTDPGLTLTLRYRDISENDEESQSETTLIFSPRGGEEHYALLESIGLIFTVEKDFARDANQLIRRTLVREEAEKEQEEEDEDE